MRRGTTSFPSPAPDVIAESNFTNTAEFRTILVFDSAQQPVSGFTIPSASGGLLHSVSEPSDDVLWVGLLDVAVAGAVGRRS